MKQLDTLTATLDDFQQKHAVLAFPAAVIKRYGDDEASKQAALITYYAFLSLFPLLLVFMTVLGIFVSNNPELRDTISSRVFQYFPALGNELKSSVGPIKAGGWALALQLLVVLYGARGLAAMLQSAFNNVWHVEKEQRPGFVGDNLRSFGMMAAVGLGLVGGTIFSYVLGNVFDYGIISKVLLGGLNLAVTFGLFLAVFRLGTASKIGLHCLWPGAVIASIGVLLVQYFGNYIMSQQLTRLDSTYGSFALALGMLFWIFLQAQVIMYALEITAVRAQHDWPKKLF